MSAHAPIIVSTSGLPNYDTRQFFTVTEEHCRILGVTIYRAPFIGLTMLRLVDDFGNAVEFDGSALITFAQV